MPSKKTTAGKRVKALRHDEAKRPNNPTAEMENFMSETEAAPVRAEYARNAKGKAERSARDSDLDPQLVWRGKDEEDKTRLVVNAVPIYKQETIAPEAIIKDLQKQAATTPQAGGTAQLFDDFAVWRDKESRVEFYKHEQKWANRMILGDSLLAMTSLAHKENFRGKVQCVFMDPPYGVNFKSNWQTSTKASSTADKDETHEPEMLRAFRDTWHDGIHSYLSYLRDRLTVSRDLLTESGSIFLQIGDENVHLVSALMDEVFGKDNRIAIISYATTSGSSGKNLPKVADYLLWYAKDEKHVKYKQLYEKLSREEIIEHFSSYAFLELRDGTTRSLTKAERFDPENNIPEGARIFKRRGVDSQGISITGRSEPYTWRGKKFPCAPNRQWSISNDPTKEPGLDRMDKAGRLHAMENIDTLGWKYYEEESPGRRINNLWSAQMYPSDKRYVVQTANKVIQRCILMTTEPGDLVLDPTCGSGTTAAVAEEWGRRWITIDTSRVALAIARARIMGARYDYYLLKDSAEGAREETKLSGKPATQTQFNSDIRHGFVYDRVDTVSPKLFADNAEIDEIWEKWQAKIPPLLAELNAAVGESWQEWEVPPQAEKGWKPAAQKAHENFCQAKSKRQEEMNASIAKNAKTEYLVDQPLKSPRIVRVTGPFTFESLSPYRVVAPEGKDTSPNANSEERLHKIVYETLKRAGIKTGRKEERLQLQDLQPFESVGKSNILFEGYYQENDKTKRAAVCVGPEFGAITTAFLRACAIQAAKMFDTLIMLGFAFEPGADESFFPEGKLKIVCARINNDLHMADRLKEEEDANLFASIGEPDIACEKTEDGQWRATLRGIDIYNPAKGEVRSAKTKEIACWFIDTDYDETQFFVRHAYFTGGGKDPYKQLKRALNTEINAEIWASLYSDTSRPFPAPSTGKIAVKAINHYGDEVLKVIAIPPQK